MDYVNQHGFHRADPTWLSGQVAAKWSWVLCDIPPLDYVEFRRLVQLVGGPNARISPRGFVVLTLAHFLKWPAAVAHFREELQELGESPEQGWSAAKLLDAFWHAVEAMDGLELAKMHESMSKKGRMHCGTGLVVHAQWLGILEKDGLEKDGDQEKAVVRELIRKLQPEGGGEKKSGDERERGGWGTGGGS